MAAVNSDPRPGPAAEPPARHPGGGDQPSAPAAEAGGQPVQFISFTVDEDEYGVDIMAVREIKGWTGVTALPNQPDYMRGVLNLRGVIVPIYDMRRRFGMERGEPTPMHVVIIVAVRDRIVGLLVDRVSDIVTTDTAEIRPVPQVDRVIDARYLTGLVTIEDRMIAVLELDALFQDEIANPTGGAAPAERARQ